MMNTFLPKNLDIKYHVENNSYDIYGFLEFNLDYAYYILGLIETIPARNKDSNDIRDTNGGYTRMCARHMQSFVPDYKKYLNYFISTNIIETNGKYSATNLKWAEPKCYGYKFTDKYKGVELVAQNYSKSFSDRLFERFKKQNRSLKKDYGHLLKWLYPECQLEINADLAYSFIKAKKQAQLKNPELQDDDVDRITGIIRKKDPLTQYSCAYQSIFELKNKNIFFKKDDTVNRFHSNLTNIKSELRNLLTYNGETLYSIDITCSQPYLTLALFNPNIAFLVKDILLLKDNILILKKFWSCQNDDDVRRFKKLVSKWESYDHDFYLYIKEESEQYGITYKERSEVKTGVFSVLFSNNNYKTTSKKMFTKLFPTVDKLYRELKSDDNSVLACLLQQIEAYVILQVITKMISKKYPDAPIFTIHDSIATTDKYKDVVQSRMERELKKLTKYKPKLKVDKWIPEALEWEKYQ